ncbi:MAG: erythromycin biosynthesis sensory transduction protein eryC1 [Gemmatimonadetes bacterium]|nr:erythromycin biosynthesis sensory transduction protein eryC1 [Gemmatimonadota bacterium]
MIPFLDLKAQYDAIRSEIQAAIDETVESSRFILGPQVEAFETEFARYCRSDHAVGVSSGTSALQLALMAAGVGPGDEVVTVSCTFVATVAAIYHVGAQPVLVDVDPRSLTLDPARLEDAISDRTRAVVPVHLHGQMADMDPIMEIARRKRIAVIEDAAQAHGAEYRGRRAGSIGDLGCFSFYPGKNLGAYGEAGAVVTGRADLADTLRVLRDQGQDRKYHHILPGFNFRMDGIQGAILRVKLRHIEEWTEARRRHAALYGALLESSPVAVPVEVDGNRHVYHVYGVRVSHRDRVQALLDDASVCTGIHYPVPVHLQPAFAELGMHQGDLPVTEDAADSLLSLPMFPEMRDEQIRSVYEVLDRSVARAGEKAGRGDE